MMPWSPALIAYARGREPWTDRRLRHAVESFMLPRAGPAARPPDHIDRLVRALAATSGAGWLQSDRLVIRSRRHGAGVRLRTAQGVQWVPPESMPVLDARGRVQAERIHPHLSDRTHWIMTFLPAGELEPARIDEGRWFLDHARRAVDLIEADFAALTTGPAMLAMGHADPRDYAWPVMVMSDASHDASRADRIIESPAAFVLQLPSGAWWIEVADNPFLVTQNELDAFAEHMGLKPSIAPLHAEGLDLAHGADE